MSSIDVVKAIVVTILATSCTASFIAATVSVVTSREVSSVYSREAPSRQDGLKKSQGLDSRETFTATLARAAAGIIVRVLVHWRPEEIRIRSNEYGHQVAGQWQCGD